jgi:hypothetical protein
MAARPMVVLHLDTGHVLAAAAVEGATPTVDGLTGGSHLSVRVPLSRVVTVPLELLTLLSTDVDLDVLAMPTLYRVVDAVPRLSFVGAPATAASGDVIGTAGQQCLSVWQVGSAVEVVREQLPANGKSVLPKPPGATHRIVACPGQPLRYSSP